MPDPRVGDELVWDRPVLVRVAEVDMPEPGRIVVEAQDGTRWECAADAPELEVYDESVRAVGRLRERVEELEGERDEAIDDAVREGAEVLELRLAAEPVLRWLDTLASRVIGGQ